MWVVKQQRGVKLRKNAEMIMAVWSLMIVMCVFSAAFSLTSDMYSTGLLHYGREEILEEKLGCDG